MKESGRPEQQHAIADQQFGTSFFQYPYRYAALPIEGIGG